MDPRFSATRQIFRMSCMQENQVLTSSNAALAATGFYFQLSALPNASAYTGLFDEFRIVRVECALQWGFTQNPETAAEPAVWASCVDLDNAASPGSLNAVEAKPDAIVSTLTVPHYHAFAPRLALATYNGAFTAYSDPDTNLWVDTANAGVQYYGVKVFVGPTAVNSLPLFGFVKYFVEFRGISS